MQTSTQGLGRQDVDLEQIRQLGRVAARAAASKKGEGTVVLEVGRVLGITDLFVVTSGANPRQVRAIAEEVEARLKLEGVAPSSVEGLDDVHWVLLDYGDLVVHVFLEEVRQYYELERLWADAPRVDWDGGWDADRSADVGTGRDRDWEEDLRGQR